MKRDFLQNFKVGDQALSKEAIDAIMAENGRDIEAAKAQFADYETIKSQLSEAQKAIQGFQSQGQDMAYGSGDENHPGDHRQGRQLHPALFLSVLRYMERRPVLCRQRIPVHRAAGGGERAL